MGNAARSDKGKLGKREKTLVLRDFSSGASWDAAIFVVDQCREFPQSFRQNILPDATDERGPTTLPIEAAHLIRQNHASYRQTVGQ
jgi:hypothetical protein